MVRLDLSTGHLSRVLVTAIVAIGVICAIPWLDRPTWTMIPALLPFLYEVRELASQGRRLIRG